MTAPLGGQLMKRPDALDEVEYPVSDGVPLGETDQHRNELVHYAVDVLARHFREAPDVYVSGNNFLYYAQGDPRSVVSPDTYVVRGVAPHLRRIFKVWEEGGNLPCFVLEITSRGTRREDLGEKMFRYRDELRVPEYFLFDPFREWIPEGLRGFELRPGPVYVALSPRDGRLFSQQLGLELAVIEGHLRFFVPGATQPLPTDAERADQAQSRADQEQSRADQAERELARLKAELERLRGGSGLSAP